MCRETLRRFVFIMMIYYEILIYLFIFFCEARVGTKRPGMTKGLSTPPGTYDIVRLLPIFLLFYISPPPSIHCPSHIKFDNLGVNSPSKTRSTKCRHQHSSGNPSGQISEPKCTCVCCIAAGDISLCDLYCGRKGRKVEP